MGGEQQRRERGEAREDAVVVYEGGEGTDARKETEE